jgi:hypothetical protein
LINLQAGVVTPALININGGTVQGSGTINSGIINNGTLRALDGLLSLGTGGLVGSGFVSFDFDQRAGTIAAVGGVLEVHGVGPGQTFIMNGKDQLVIDTPVSFAGTIQAKAGDQFLLGGITATSATLVGQTLLLQNAGQTVKSLNLSGDYTGDVFAVSAFGGTSTAVNIRNGAADLIGPNFTVLDTTTGASSGTAGTPYSGPVPGLLHQYINITTDSLNITATAPNSFIVSGTGQDAINVSSVNGNNVIDGGGGSNFLTGGTGNDQFYVDVRNLTTGIFSTIANFHSGDNATIFGVTLADFNVHLFDNAGAPGFTGLTFAFTQAGHPTANLDLAGYSIADLTNGRLSQTFGTTPDLPGLPGSPFLTIHAA